jgi:hypothetical protein
MNMLEIITAGVGSNSGGVAVRTIGWAPIPKKSQRPTADSERFVISAASITNKYYITCRPLHMACIADTKAAQQWRKYQNLNNTAEQSENEGCRIK